MIRDIIFDLGKVLCPLDWTTAYERLMPHLPGHTRRMLLEDRECFKELFKGPANALESGEMDFSRFRQEMCEILGVRLNGDEFHRIWCDIFRMDEDMVALGERLSTQYGTWLASNTSKVHYKWILARFPRVAFYRAAALSYELGVMKPAPAYYEKAIALFGIEPSLSVFIDDIEENVAGAMRFGMRGILFRSRTQLIEELKGLGVVVPGL